MADVFADAELAAGAKRAGWRDFVRRNPMIVAGAGLLGFMTLLALAAPWIAGDPLAIEPLNRLRPPSAANWFGTDHLGRDVYTRTIYGTQISLMVGLSVAAISISVGLAIGLVAGYVRWLDGPVLRVMDGLMAIPAILLAIGLIALNKASVGIVIFAIAVPEIPRVVRLVRSVVLTVRERLFVEAAIAGGMPRRRIVVRHILPSTIAPLVVQATYVCGSAILIEAGLSFLGAGTPPEIPTWGNMIANSRVYLQLAPWGLFYPSLLLAITVLAVNLLGDGLRDRLDPQIARRM
ncbi:MAG: ABC transporter permease [Alphaproteobacteria bacterium]|nr:ABC transporter permease [Alphaproteobacteria bacterium]